MPAFNGPPAAWQKGFHDHIYHLHHAARRVGVLTPFRTHRPVRRHSNEQP